MIPDKVRTVIYVVLFFVGLFVSAANILGAQTLLTFPIDNWEDVFIYLGTVFGITAASNVKR
jgi:hypothetical protein